MFSTPPAITTSASPHITAWAASMTERRPEAQTMLMVRAVFSLGIPEWIRIWRATFWPSPAVRTLPMMTSSTKAGSRPPALSKAALTAVTPISTGLTPVRPPPNLPTAVRAALTITASGISTPQLAGPRGNRIRFPPGPIRTSCSQQSWRPILLRPGRAKPFRSWLSYLSWRNAGSPALWPRRRRWGAPGRPTRRARLFWPDPGRVPFGPPPKRPKRPR